MRAQADVYRTGCRDGDQNRCHRTSGSGSTGYGQKSFGGNAGILTATIPVTAGEKLAVFVGGEGGTSGGFNGGASSGGASGSGGGGSSFVERRVTHVRNAQGGAPTGNGRIVISW
jgi:hypothetical protein